MARGDRGNAGPLSLSSPSTLAISGSQIVLHWQVPPIVTPSFRQKRLEQMKRLVCFYTRNIKWRCPVLPHRPGAIPDTTVTIKSLH